MAFKTQEEKLAYEAKMQQFYATMAPVASETTHSQKNSVPNLTQDQMAESVASGKHRYDMDQLIGWQVIGGVLCIAVGAFSTVPLGLGLLALTLWLRTIV
jgi:hypothetical protein